MSRFIWYWGGASAGPPPGPPTVRNAWPSWPGSGRWAVSLGTGGERAPLRPQAPPPFGTRGRAGQAPVDEPFHLVLGGSERRSAPRPPHRSERVAELARLR